MNRQLKDIGAIPITTSIIESLYPELKSADKKVVWLEKNGYIIRLKRGIKVHYFKTQEISGEYTEYASCDIVESFKVDSYRGEDSGAIYPVLETRTIESYNIASILNHLINNKTIRDLIIESKKMYPYAGDLHTSYQAHAIYNYLMSLENIDSMKKEV